MFDQSRCKFGEAVFHDAPFIHPQTGHEVGPDFYDRSAAVPRAWGLLNDRACRKTILFLGERRSGKTSLVGLLHERLAVNKAETCIPIIIPWQGVFSQEQLSRELLFALRSYLSLQLGLVERVKAALPVGDTSIAGVLDAVRALLALAPNRKLVLFIDEFDSILENARQLGGALEAAQVIELVQAIDQADGFAAQLVLTVAHLPDPGSEVAASSPFASAELIALGPFPDRDLWLMAREIAGKEHPLTVDDLAALSELSGGWPYFAKLLLYHLAELPSGPGQLAAAVSGALTNTGADATIADIYDKHLRNEEKRLLLLLAARKGCLLGSEMRLLDEDLHAAAAALHQRGYVSLEGGDGCRFRIAFLTHWFPKWTRYDLELERQDANPWLMRLG